jgi:hypothetical protein
MATVKNMSVQDSARVTEQAVVVAFDESKPFEDVYADGLQMGIGPFGVVVTLARTDPATQARQVVARVRMSAQLALVMSHMLRRLLRQARDQGIGIDVPADVLAQLGIDQEKL